MKLDFIHRHNNYRLLLIFAGWGMDPGVFTGLYRRGYDIAVAWDYRDEDFDPSPLAEYGEIALLAWSMGVFAADRIVPRLQLPLSVTIAVNGTPWPINDTKGIPEAIFNGTLRGLNERSLMKFYRRMCGSSDEFARFQAHTPKRSIEELKEELQAIKDRSCTGHDGVMRWDKAIVSDNDAIIPTTNQINAWHEHEIHLIPGPHIPEWQKLVDTMLIDKLLVHDRFSKGFATYEREAEAQASSAERLWHLWQAHGTTTPAERLIEIGYGTGIFTRMYAPAINIRDWQLWDIVEPAGIIPAGARTETGDAEAGIHRIATESVDKIVSASTIQWFNSLPGFFRQAARTLKHGGELIVSTFGPLTFRELAAAGVPPLPYPDAATLRKYISGAGLKTVHISEDLICRRFASPHEVLLHIRATGVNALNATATPAQVRRILSDYPRETDGKATLTYQPIYIIATKQ